jgi:hypothetical protein
MPYTFSTPVERRNGYGNSENIGNMRGMKKEREKRENMENRGKENNGGKMIVKKGIFK